MTGLSPLACAKTDDDIEIDRAMANSSATNFFITGRLLQISAKAQELQEKLELDCAEL
jgi:hypothetical protein